MADETRNILITGGAGYIGSHTVLELLNTDFKVVVIDNLSNAYKGKGSEKPECILRVEKLANKQVTFIDCDITNKSSLSDIFSKNNFFCVIHFAALKAVGESCSIPLDYYKVNVSGTINLLEVMKENNVKRFIYSSSATVYGVPEKLPLVEGMKIGNCTNPYGKSKFMVEEILVDLCHSDEAWSVISLRYFNPVGAHSSGEIGEDPNGIPNNLMPFIAQVSVGKRESLSIYGNDYNTCDGTGVRDYIHVMDLASGHVKALIYLKTKNPTGFQAINLGSGKGHSVLEVIHAYEKASGKKIPYKIVERRAGDIASSYADANLAKKLLDWVAVKNLDDMCADTWRWQQQNPNGFSV
ncbi:UDP-glucose 4-epimerase-like [Phymastichus coffea]|uniref:UDP-glucose 4-epimerase-like n=1 Tax=Phymastichus coffea TaxID=108790 RepID=UPI00273BCF23|nr:UDP-glucose 4-epimerase-like [Phymastichus coffea]XP_058790065.1 UDP-glucose 4-epimerase-like [Phymastichus coffea]XP_058790067.1 UDP-glucose 4-epimerase-like [Phymastichus coffea]XP_058790068.1 UDP-glucose 4-epimerase-like [Phymastichus coffea]XP_058790069.1 UDP-glucose 4-epimerase-like [Phymastichus coffea]XP_058790070.1 UDP-glucose 4-epimerase-like [Phymastichus coffea]XP_058790071.1 UDP-glucose 4-epimerase-like [Phymastichus coffea]